MMTRYLALSLFTFALFGCDAMTAHTDVVARAGEHRLTVDQTLDMLAGSQGIPARADVVESVADLWIDYTILASLLAEDSTLAAFDTEALVRPYVEQQTFTQLRDQVVTTDTVFSDAELQDIYTSEQQGVRIKARHILLTYPDNATDTERDSVRSLAEELRERAVAGEDFNQLATQYSEDQGTAQQGGDLGWFERGNMVQPFEETAFSMDVGEVSEVVETPFGLHIIKLDDREARSLEEVGTEEFRTQLVNERRQASLNDYVESLREGRKLEVQDGALEVARDLADDPTSLAGRAASRELVTWDDGALTAEEVVRVFRGMPQQQRVQYSSLGDEQLAQLLQDVATNELVLADAVDRGITVSQEEQDSISGLIREQVVQMARGAGLIGAPQEGETQTQAVARRVRSFMNGVLSGQAEVLPLGSLSAALREQRDWQTNDAAVDAVVERLESRQGEGAEGRMPPAPSPETPAPVAPDTGG